MFRLCGLLVILGFVTATKAESSDRSNGFRFDPSLCQQNIVPLMHCMTAVEKEIKVNSTLLQKFLQSFINGIDVEDRPEQAINAACSLILTFDTCGRPLASSCLFPLAAAALDVYESAVAVCRNARVAAYYQEVANCFNKLHFIPKLIGDGELQGIIAEISAAMASANSFIQLMSLPADSIMNIECRILSRAQEMLSSENVEGACGTETHNLLSNLHSKMVEMYGC
ncbi:uncharacterized protein LOC129596052 [Paramacrobiotus metropolitanus]|uniref:uncharacterized protein LOC129596052 n=1 Tax=Paramacrobiotus metropolitanus TaxID=2943436 RepID=UPI0024457C26|nr:uncharacterized protein LOC129596052 [Paramacrobiotus metropolitanus]